MDKCFFGGTGNYCEEKTVKKCEQQCPNAYCRLHAKSRCVCEMCGLFLCDAHESRSRMNYCKKCAMSNNKKDDLLK
jgi:hypothetical protein